MSTTTVSMDKVTKLVNYTIDNNQQLEDKGVTPIAISLEATEMGRPLYEKYGFIKMNDEMELR